MTEPASPPASPEESGEASSKPLPEVAPPPAPTGAIADNAPAYKPNYVFLVVVSVVSLVLDLGTKYWAKIRLEDKSWSERRIDVIKGFFSFIFAKNRGGAWGLLQDEPETVRRPFFLGISVLAIIFIVSLYRKLTPQQWALKWGLPLVLGGALGNLVNRIQYNYVVDFIDFSYKGHHWPTFNVADIAIVVGVGLMAVDMFTPNRTATKTPVAATPKTDVTLEPAKPLEAPAPKPAPSGAPEET